MKSQVSKQSSVKKKNTANLMIILKFLYCRAPLDNRLIATNNELHCDRLLICVKLNLIFNLVPVCFGEMSNHPLQLPAVFVEWFFI